MEGQKSYNIELDPKVRRRIIKTRSMAASRLRRKFKTIECCWMGEQESAPETLRDYLDGLQGEEHDYCIVRISEILCVEHNEFYRNRGNLIEMGFYSGTLSEHLPIAYSMIQNEPIPVNNLLLNVEAGDEDFSPEVYLAHLRIFVMLIPLLDSSSMATNTQLVNQLKEIFLKGEEPGRSYAGHAISAFLNSPFTQSIPEFDVSSLMPTILLRLKHLKESLDFDKPAVQDVETIPDSQALKPKRRKSHGKSCPNDPNILVSSSSLSGNTSVNTPNDSVSLEDCAKNGPTLQFKPIHYDINNPTISMQMCILMNILRGLKFETKDLDELMGISIVEMMLFFCNFRKHQDDAVAFHALLLLSNLVNYERISNLFLRLNGISKILRIPMDSMSSSGVIVCLDSLAYSYDSIPLMHSISEAVITESIEYYLKLFLTEGQSRRDQYHCFLTSMLNHSSKFVKEFDKAMGLDRIFMHVSTFKILNPIVATMMDENELLWERSKSKVFVTICKSYAESHLTIFYYQLLKRTDNFPSNFSNDNTDFRTKIDSALLSDLRFQWSAMKHFVSLGGISILLRMMNFSKKTWKPNSRTGQDYISCTIDALSIYCLVPSSLPYFLEKMEDSEEVFYGVTLVVELLRSLKSIEYNCKASIVQLICNLVEIQSCESPILSLIRTRCEIRQILIHSGIFCEIIRIFQLSGTVYEDDFFRLRAFCMRCLAAFGSDPNTCSMISKLVIFTSGQVFQMLNENISTTKGNISQQLFINYSFILFEKIFDQSPANLYNLLPLSSVYNLNNFLPILERKIKSKMSITYPKNELIYLIYDYLKKDYPETASMLLLEAHIDSFPRPMARLEIPCSTSSSACQSSSSSRFMPSIISSSQPPRLEQVIINYLSEQHLKCSKPLTTCAPFSLLKPHKCMKPLHFDFAPQHIMLRLEKMKYSNHSFAGFNGRKYNTHLVYESYSKVPGKIPIVSDYWYVRSAAMLSPETILTGDDDGYLTYYTTKGQKLSHKFITEGSLYEMFLSKDRQKLITCIRSSFNVSAHLWGISDPMRVDGLLEMDGASYAQFSNDIQKILTTEGTTAVLYDLHTGTEIRQFCDPIQSTPVYSQNRAVLNDCDVLVLNDGMLFDIRSESALHDFSKFGDVCSGVFGPNDLDVIMSSDIWDLRTLKLKTSVPKLTNSHIIFNNASNVLYSLKYTSQKSKESGLPMYSSVVEVLHAYDYSHITTLDFKSPLYHMNISSDDRYLVPTLKIPPEMSPTDNNRIDTEYGAVKLYEIGRRSRLSEDSKRTSTNLSPSEDERQQDSSEDSFSSDDLMDDSAYMSDEDDDDDEGQFEDEEDDMDDEDDDEDDDSYDDQEDLQSMYSNESRDDTNDETLEDQPSPGTSEYEGDGGDGEQSGQGSAADEVIDNDFAEYTSDIEEYGDDDDHDEMYVIDNIDDSYEEISNSPNPETDPESHEREDNDSTLRNSNEGNRRVRRRLVSQPLRRRRRTAGWRSDSIHNAYQFFAALHRQLNRQTARNRRRNRNRGRTRNRREERGGGDSQSDHAPPAT